MSEERIDATDRVLAEVARVMGIKLDQHSLQLDSIRNQLNEQEITLYEHGAILQAHTRDIREIKLRMGNVEGKLGDLDRKVDALSSDVKQIIALLSKAD